MTVAAMSFDDHLWEQMFDDNLDSDGVRRIASAVNAAVHNKIKDLEIKFCGRQSTDKFKTLKNQRAVATKWHTILKKMKSDGKYDNDQVDAFIKKQLGEGVKEKQRSITDFTGAKKK